MLNVFLTIDVECGDFSIDYNGSVHGISKKAQKRAYGLEFILQTLREHNLKATFFVETFASFRFGLEGLREICEKILHYEQDIQLHVHPNFLPYSSILDLDSKVCYGLLWEYSLGDQKKILECGKDVLSRCGIDNIFAFRAGGFGANNTTLRALREGGFIIDSSYNQNYLNRACRITSDEDLNDLGIINGIYEIPISNIRVNFLPWQRPKHLQVGATSSGDMITAMKQAVNNDFRSLCIIFHSNEFIFYKNDERSEGIPNYVNIQRLRKICAFLSKNRTLIRTNTMSDLKNDISKGLVKYSPNKPLNVNVLDFGVRIAEQLGKRIFLKGYRTFVPR